MILEGYSLLPNLTTGWFIWENITKNVSHKTHVCCETNFVKIFQMNQPVVTFGSKERSSHLTNFRNNNALWFILIKHNLQDILLLLLENHLQKRDCNRIRLWSRPWPWPKKLEMKKPPLLERSSRWRILTQRHRYTLQKMWPRHESQWHPRQNLPASWSTEIKKYGFVRLVPSNLMGLCTFPVKRSQIPMQLLVTEQAIPAAVDKETESICNSCRSMWWTWQ